MADTIRSLIIFVSVLSLVMLTGYPIHIYLGQASLAAWGSYLSGVGTLILAIAALYTGWRAVKEYAARTRSEQVRWLGSLFNRLFEDSLYRRMRQKIDYDDLDDVAALLERNKKPDENFSQEERDLLDQFTDYLNFFEFIALLSKKEQVAAKDVNAIFDYYLKRFGEVKHHKLIEEYLRQDGFENLQRLLIEYQAGAKGHAGQ